MSRLAISQTVAEGCSCPRLPVSRPIGESNPEQFTGQEHSFNILKILFRPGGEIQFILDALDFHYFWFIKLLGQPIFFKIGFRLDGYFSIVNPHFHKFSFLIFLWVYPFNNSLKPDSCPWFSAIFSASEIPP